MREKIRAVMRYAGPRMLYHHPLLAFYHMIDGMRKEPCKAEHRIKKSIAKTLIRKILLASLLKREASLAKELGSFRIIFNPNMKCLGLKGFR
jgi:hypothetical protein